MTEVSEETAIRFSEYLDDEMTAAERAAFEAELDADPSLRAEFDAFAATIHALGSLGSAGSTPEIDLTEGVRTRIRRRSRGRYFGDRSLYRERQQTTVFLLIAAAILIAGALVASPDVLRVVLGDPEIVAVDDGSGEGEQRPAPNGEHAPPNDAPTPGDGAPTTGDGAPTPDDDAPRAPTDPEALMNAEPRSGATSGGPIAPIVHQDFVYTVTTSERGDALRARVRDQFGMAPETDDEGALVVAVPRGQGAALLEQVGDLGPVTRELAPSADRSTMIIRFVSTP